MNSWDLSVDYGDVTVEEIHAWREAYAAHFQNDLDRIFEDLKAKEGNNTASRFEGEPLKPHRRRP